MKFSRWNLIVLAVLCAFTMDAHATDLMAGFGTSIGQFLSEKELYLPLGLIAVVLFIKSRI